MHEKILYRMKLPDDFNIPPVVIVLPFRKMFQELKCRERKDIPPGIGEACFLKNVCVIYDVFSGQKNFFIASLLFASGVEQLIFYGTAGDLTGKFQIGEIVLPEIVASTFGFIDYKPYNEVRFCPPDGMKRFSNLQSGKVLTVFSPLEESYEFISESRKKGFELVEMELFPLMIAGKLYSRQIYPFLIVSDRFEEGKWRPFFTEKNFIEKKFGFFEELVKYAEELV